jgi:hypothetical protein
MTQFVVAVLHVPHVARPMMELSGFIPLYVGPDQMLPVMSALGAIVGVLLMVWHRVVAFVRKAFRSVMRRPAPEDASAVIQPPENQP